MTHARNRTEDAVSMLTGVIAALPALATLAAWHLHYLPPMQWTARSVPMQYNTALGLLLLAGGFLLLRGDRIRLAQLPAAAAVSIGLVTLAEHLFKVDLHIDQLFLKAWLVAAENAAPGRMAANSALCLVVAGLALLAIGAGWTLRRYGALTVALAGSLVCAIVLVAIVGYLTNIESGYRWGHFNKMAANTAFSFLIAGAGLIVRALSDAGGGHPLRCRWTPALLGGAATVFTLLLWQAMLGEQRAAQILTTQGGAAQIGIRIRVVTENLIHAVMRLEKRWPVGHASPAAEWQSDAASYFGDYPGLRAIEWVNESSGDKRVAPPGIDDAWSPQFLEMQASAMQAARRQQAAVASGIVDIGQGKKGFLIVAPGPGSGSRSYTIGVVEMEPWLTSIISKTAASRYSIEVTTGGVAVFHRGAANAQGIAAGAQSDAGIPGASWMVHLWPGSEALSATESPLAVGVLVAGLLMALLLALTAHLIRAAHENSKSLEGANRNMEAEIRERRLAEASLLEARRTAEEATRAKSDFLARMSHEIRTPMNAILGMASLLWETRLDDEQRQYVGAFRRAGENLLTLINEILDLSKIEAGRIELQSIGFELDDLVKAALDLVRVRAGDKGLDLVCELSPEIHRSLRGDPDRLRQVLINLLGNAVKFTAAGHVCLRVEREPAETNGLQTLRFSISDTGAGIPLDQQALIFESFTQADGSISRQYGGTGLGLTMSRQIVERMGGRLEVSSASGKGSTFSFAVSFEMAPKRKQRPDSTDGPSYKQPAGLRILLVEDSEDNQLLISAYLKETARTLTIATDGQAAVDKFASGVFDLVLMDVEMPVMDGYAATRRIREWEARQGAGRTPILALSAHAMGEAFEKSREAGCDAHLTKPIRKETLLHAIAEHCKAHDAIWVSPSKEIRELAPWYLDKRRSDLLALAAALTAADYDAIRIMGHNMKGSGAGYGFEGITKIGASLEAAAKKESDGTIGTEIAALGDYLDRVEVVSG